MNNSQNAVQQNRAAPTEQQVTDAIKAWFPDRSYQAAFFARALFGDAAAPDDTDHYAEGMEAAHSGKVVAHCPHPYDSEKGKEWMQGFDGAGER